MISPPRTRILRVSVGGRDLVVKTSPGRGRAALRREAEVLGTLAGSGVVHLVALRESDDRTDLVLDDAGSADLARASALPTPVLVRALATAAGAVAELHLAGWAHGALSSEHLVVDADGRTRLCSLGSAVAVAEGEPEPILHDVAQLRTILLRHLRGHRVTNVRDRVRWSRDRRTLERTVLGASTAGELSAVLDHVADMWTPQDPAPTEVIGRPVEREPASAGRLRSSTGPWELRTGATTRPRSGRTRPPIGTVARTAAILIALVGVLGLARYDLWIADSGADATSGRVEPLRHVCASGTGRDEHVHEVDVDGDGCPEDVSVAANRIDVGGTTYELGATGDVVALGDWDCDGADSAMLLRPSSHELFEFDGWASADTVEHGRRLGVIDGAADFGTRESHDDSCDRIQVTLLDGTTASAPDDISPSDS